MSKIKIEKIIKADRNKIYDILTNYENFEKNFAKYFPSIRIRSERDGVSVIEEHLVLGKKEFVMMTKHIKNPPYLHEIIVIGGDCKGSRIIEKYDIVPEGTKLTVEADFRLGLFRKPNVSDGLESIIDEFVRVAEN
ncbi:MAG: polyketide cyclase [Thaumarchaeota archaeon]|nr:polyketide cyclase [Nitrososphaerota archaeon]